MSLLAAARGVCHMIKRPRGVTIIGVLLFVQGLVEAVAVARALAPLIPPLAHALPPGWVVAAHAPSNSDWIGLGTQAVVAVLSLVGGVGMLRLRPWAWVVAMLLEGYALTLYLWAYFRGHPLYLQMLIAAVIVFYLNTRAVRHVFDAVRRHAASSATPVTLPTGALDGSQSPALGDQSVHDRQDSAPETTHAPGVS